MLPDNFFFFFRINRFVRPRPTYNPLVTSDFNFFIFACDADEFESSADKDEDDFLSDMFVSVFYPSI